MRDPKQKTFIKTQSANRNNYTKNKVLVTVTRITQTDNKPFKGNVKRHIVPELALPTLVDR